MIKTIKKLLSPLSLISITGCNTTGLIVREGEKIIYPFTWAMIIALFIITIAILLIIRYFIKNTK